MKILQKYIRCLSLVLTFSSLKAAALHEKIGASAEFFEGFSESMKLLHTTHSSIGMHRNDILRTSIGTGAACVLGEEGDNEEFIPGRLASMIAGKAPSRLMDELIPKIVGLRSNITELSRVVRTPNDQRLLDLIKKSFPWMDQTEIILNRAVEMFVHSKFPAVEDERQDDALAEEEQLMVEDPTKMMEVAQNLPGMLEAGQLRITLDNMQATLMCNIRNKTSNPQAVVTHINWFLKAEPRTDAEREELEEWIMIMFGLSIEYKEDGSVESLKNPYLGARRSFWMVARDSIAAAGSML